MAAVTDRPHDDAAEQLIPAEYEPRAPQPRQPGAISGPAYGTELKPAETMDSDTVAEHEREGGGAPSERHRD
jgi:hypothetical protein